jgi:hypothetical protein
MTTLFTDRHGNPTDDSDRWLAGHETTFDYDPAPDCDDDYDRGGPNCAREWNGWRGCCCDHEGKFVGPGCRACNPPDHEGKPYGWGIERSEDPALELANREMKKRRPAALYTTAGAFAKTYWKRERDGRIMLDEKNAPVIGVVVEEPACAIDTDTRDMIWRAWSKWDARLAKLSERVWGRLCDDCATHTEAVARYTKWAERKTGKRVNRT